MGLVAIQVVNVERGRIASLGQRLAVSILAVELVQGVHFGWVGPREANASGSRLGLGRKRELPVHESFPVLYSHLEIGILGNAVAVGAECVLVNGKLDRRVPRVDADLG